MERAELEDRPTVSRLHGIAQIGPIERSDEPHPERDAPRQRTEDVAKERDPPCLVELRSANLLRPAPERDRRATGCAQVLHPMDIPERRPDPAPIADRDDRDGR